MGIERKEGGAVRVYVARGEFNGLMLLSTRDASTERGFER